MSSGTGFHSVCTALRSNLVQGESGQPKKVPAARAGWATRGKRASITRAGTATYHTTAAPVRSMVALSATKVSRLDWVIVVMQ